MLMTVSTAAAAMVALSLDERKQAFTTATAQRLRLLPHCCLALKRILVRSTAAGSACSGPAPIALAVVVLAVGGWASLEFHFGGLTSPRNRTCFSSSNCTVPKKSGWKMADIIAQKELDDLGE